MKKCPHCGHELPDTAVLCKYCSTRLNSSNFVFEKSQSTSEHGLSKCPRCGHTDNRPNAVNCWKCGINLKAAIQAKRPDFNFYSILPILVLIIIPIGIYFTFFYEKSPDNNPEPAQNIQTTKVPTERIIYAKDFVKITDYKGKIQRNIEVIKITGEVKNTGNYTLRFIEIRATIFTDVGEQVNTTTGYIDSDILMPGTTSTFTIYVDDPKGKASKFKVEVEEAYFEE